MLDNEHQMERCPTIDLLQRGIKVQYDVDVEDRFEYYK